MTTEIIITGCILLLLAYLFDISSGYTRIPSVILLLLLGWGVRQLTILFEVEISDLRPLLPILGTIGLILIVLEGALELELNKSKAPIIKKSLLSALVPMIVLSLLLALVFNFMEPVSFKTCLINAIPFCVISSAIAIPSVRNFSSSDKEFVIYESSLSDILGVMFFNYILLTEVVNVQSLGHFALQIVIVTIISFVSVAGLSLMLSRIKHHITYAPIILLIILIYTISKEFHLPALIFILIFGLFLGNLDELKRFKWIQKLRPEKMGQEVLKFKDITYEATFLIRAWFFIIFGFLMDAKEILNTKTLPLSVAIVAAIFLVRWLTLKIIGLPSTPLLYIAPRGLITILLFISIIPENTMGVVNQSLVIQVIIVTVLAMIIGLIKRENITIA